jgi:Uma2 family endonuclease
MGKRFQAEHYTVADWRQWEGDWELIQGAPYAMAPSPGFLHQAVAAAIHGELYRALEPCPHCLTLFETDVEFAEDTVVRPDVLVICYAPEGERLTRVPELVFEVVSRQTARRDEHTKFELYASEGVRYYVLVYPEARKAKVYQWLKGKYLKLGDFHSERQCFELSKCSFEFDFSRLWLKQAGS